MPVNRIQQALLADHKLRITPAMSAYILDRLKSDGEGEIPIIAGDARTGVPVRTTIPAALLTSLVTESEPTQP